MPYIQIPPEVFLEHEGVEVFYTYRSGTDEPWTYWFTTDPDASDSEDDPSHFDARSLTGKWDGTPNVQQWDDYWKPRFKTENDAVVALIRTAIDSGRITAANEK